MYEYIGIIMLHTGGFLLRPFQINTRHAPFGCSFRFLRANHYTYVVNTDHSESVSSVGVGSRPECVTERLYRSVDIGSRSRL